MNTSFEPYAAPRKSSSGRTCLIAGVGCSVIAVLMFLAVGAFFAVRFQKAASAPRLNATQARAILPADVPIHPAMTFDEMRTHMASSGIRMVGSFVKNTELQNMHQLIYTVPTGAEPVLDWYGQTLPKRGWQAAKAPTQQIGPVKSVSEQFRKGDTMLMLSTTSTEPKVLTVIVMKHLRPGVKPHVSPGVPPR